MNHENLHLDGSKSTLFMKFERKLPAAQGMDIWEDRAFILFDTGYCGVYNLQTRDPEAVDLFPLGSYNSGVPSRDYLNHANSCMFSGEHRNGNPIPLLYVTIGTGTGADKDGYFYRCAVEELICTRRADGTEHYKARTVQVISYQPEGIEATPYEPPCWGCPAFFVDSVSGLLYIFSARYRTKRGCVPEGKKNAYIVTKFQLPDVERGGLVHLTPQDIQDQFAVESNVLFTQGGALYDNRIYYTFGCPKGGYPNRVLVFDLIKRELDAAVENLDEAFFEEEIECCARYRGKLLCNTTSGSIFALEDGLVPL